MLAVLQCLPDLAPSWTSTLSNLETLTVLQHPVALHISLFFAKSLLEKAECGLWLSFDFFYLGPGAGWVGLPPAYESLTEPKG